MSVAGLYCLNVQCFHILYVTERKFKNSDGQHSTDINKTNDYLSPKESLNSDGQHSTDINKTNDFHLKPLNTRRSQRMGLVDLFYCV